jgi:FkbM family methyltransferase
VAAGRRDALLLTYVRKKQGERMPRELGRILGAAFRPQHYLSVWNSSIYLDWSDFFVRRYVLGRGDYPCVCRIRTPSGAVSLTLYCPEDCYTVQEVFGLHCYRAKHERVFVDFGANIGVSAAYFLSRNPEAFVYCFEPLPENVERLRRNLAPYDGRYKIEEVAVADYDGEIEFRVERTGRYSGIENRTGDLRRFPCVNANRVLTSILRAHGQIDLLKVDVEGAETMFLPSLEPEVLEKVTVLCVEGKDVLVSPRFSRSRSVSGVLRYTSRPKQ